VELRHPVLQREGRRGRGGSAKGKKKRRSSGGATSESSVKNRKKRTCEVGRNRKCLNSGRGAALGGVGVLKEGNVGLMDLPGKRIVCRSEGRGGERPACKGKEKEVWGGGSSKML